MISTFNFASDLRVRLVIKKYVLNAVLEISKRTFKLLLYYGRNYLIFCEFEVEA